MNIVNIKDTSGKLFYIGGVVRDELLQRESFDVDITYVGNAIEYCKKFGQTIRENPDFGTIRVRVDGKDIDFASTRLEVYEKKGHLPVITKIGCTLKDDVMRRDFTINSLAKSVSTGEIIDYTGGLKDLQSKKLRVLHDESFIDDPTRIIRGLKFSVRFGFELDEHTKKLQDAYLADINYDMCYKRIKKELVETFNLNSQVAFEKFIEQGIYKLISDEDVELPDINIENLIGKYPVKNIWLVYASVIKDLSRLELTRQEKKILDDFYLLQNCKMSDDFSICKAFENVELESILLYAIWKNENIAYRYLDFLQNIKVSVTGKDLANLGIKPSPLYKKIFDEVLLLKLKNPDMTKIDELKFITENCSGL